MGVIAIFMGGLMIGIGLFTKKYPYMISGYNTMSRAKKKNVDIEGLSTYLRNVMVVIGVVIIAGFYIFKFAGMWIAAELMLIFPMLIGGGVLLVGAQKFDRNKKKKISKYIAPVLYGVLIVIVVSMLLRGYKPPVSELKDDSIIFKGQYGVEIPYSHIDNIEMTDHIPRVKVRVNGSSFAGSNKGFFTLEEYGRCRLLLHVKNKSPYLIITDKDGKKTIFNVKDSDMAQDYYTYIKNKTGKVF